jgi:hypothetical protein
LSSALIFLAIVAIWAIVLVPRWLKPVQRDHSDGAFAGDQAVVREGAGHPVEFIESEEPLLQDVALAEGAEGGGQHGETSGATADGGDGDRGERAGQPAAGETAVGQPGAQDQRARVLRTRRRTLLMLLALNAAALLLVAAHLEAGWTVFPPLVVLAGFLMLLRTAVRIDAGRAHRVWQVRAAAAGAALPVAGDPGRSVASAYADGPDHRDVIAGSAARGAADPPRRYAEVIQLSARKEDQLYDQYLDAEVRAVGD